MSTHPSYADHSSYSQGYPSQRPNQTQDLKASFDDLIDEYAAPYAPNSGHQTYNVDAQMSGDLRRGQSKSFAQKPSFSVSAKSLDDSELTHSTYPPLAAVKEVDTRTLWQKILPESLACRLFVFTVLIETTIDLAIEAELLVRINRERHDDGDQVASRKMPVYLSVFALAHVFQFVMALDAVYARNTLQFIFLTMFNALFLVYAIIQIGEIRSAVTDPSVSGISSIPINVLTAIIPVVISIAELFYIGLGWKIYNEFGWQVYKFLGADRKRKKMYANYQIFECLVKFDVFFWVGFSVQFIWLVLQPNDWEYYVTCAALPLSLVLLVEGHLAARHENKWMMATFMSGCVGALVYFIYKLVKVLIYKNTQFRLVYKSLTVFSVIAIGLLIATFVFAVIVMRNFGRGLKVSFSRKSTMRHGRFESHGPHRRGASTNLNRMSIE